MEWIGIKSVFSLQAEKYTNMLYINYITIKRTRRTKEAPDTFSDKGLVCYFWLDPKVTKKSRLFYYFSLERKSNQKFKA